MSAVINEKSYDFINLAVPAKTVPSCYFIYLFASLLITDGSDK
jgi:hypothetical protein